MAGIQSVRLYVNTEYVTPTPFTSITRDVLAAPTASLVPGVTYRYENATTRLPGLAPDTTYHLWTEVVDQQGVSGGIQYAGAHATAPDPALVYDSQLATVSLPRALSQATSSLSVLRHKPADHFWHLRALVTGPAAASASNALRLSVRDADQPENLTHSVTFAGDTCDMVNPVSHTRAFRASVACPESTQYVYSMSHQSFGADGLQRANVYTAPALSSSVPRHGVAAPAALPPDATRIYGTIEALGPEACTLDALDMRIVPPWPPCMAAAAAASNIFAFDTVDAVMTLDGASGGPFGQPDDSYENGDGTGVTTWHSRDASAQTFFLPGGSTAPARPATLFDGISFDGVNTSMQFLNSPAILDCTSLTAFVAFRPATDTPSGDRLISNKGQGGYRFYIYSYGIQVLTSHIPFVEEHMPQPGKWSVAAARVDGAASQTGWIDGVRFFHKAETPNGSDNNFTIGSYDNRGGFYKGEIGEVILHPGPMNDADVDSVNAYLVAKWLGPFAKDSGFI